jgi:hypothetical protein
MTSHEPIVSRIVSQARLPGARRRHEIERELCSHLEDIVDEARSQGCSDAAIQRMLEERFGSAEEIATGFAFVYRHERLVRSIFCWGTLLVSSLIVVAAVVASIQSVATISTGISLASLYATILHETIGLTAIVLGYCSLCLGEHLFPASPAKTVVPCLALALAIPFGLTWIRPEHATLPLVAFSCAALARLLQKTEIPLLWIAGIAGPLFIAWAFLGPLPVGHGRFPWLVWLGLTSSCKVLEEIVGLFEQFVFEQSS